MSGKKQVAFIKPEEPAFLKIFKKRVGYKEGPTIEDKQQQQPLDTTNPDERPDEKPTIVVLKAGDLTEEEVNALEINQSQIKPADEPDAVDLQPRSSTVTSEFATETETEILEEKHAELPKVVFRKPHKRPQDDDINVSSTSGSAANKKPKPSSEMDRVQNKSLLSFNDEESED